MVAEIESFSSEFYNVIKLTHNSHISFIRLEFTCLNMLKRFKKSKL